MTNEDQVRNASTLEEKLLIIARGLDRLEQRRVHSRAQPATGLAQLAEDRHLESVDVRKIFEHWKAKTGTNARLTPERRRLIQARLKDGYPVNDCLRAIDGCATSDFHMARGEFVGGKKYNDITLIFRNGAKLEWFRDMKSDGQSKTAAFL